MVDSADMRRSQLIHGLREAAELEHVLMCQYLFAAMSLKTRPEEFEGDHKEVHYELVRQWKRKLLHVAREEMQHLAWTQSLLVAAGGTPHLGRPNFPCELRFYRSPADPDGLPMDLAPFDTETAERFVRYETAPAPPPPAAPSAVPEPNRYESVRALYGRIQGLFTDDMFVAPDDEQYDPVDEAQQGVRLPRRRRTPNTVRSALEARDLIEEIVRQGEGATEDDPSSHAAIFKGIKSEYAQLEKEGGQPFRPVVKNPAVRAYPETESHSNLVRTDSLQWLLLQGFNTSYELLLLWLSQLFSHTGSIKQRRAIETLVYLPLMTEVLAPLGDLMTEVPFDSENAQLGNLGPSFEVFAGDLVLLPNAAAERVIQEKLCSIRSFLDASIKHFEAKDERLRTALAYVSKTVRLMGEELESRARDGWPPAERVLEDEVRGTRFDRSERTPANWALTFQPRYLSLRFRGWFQCRLATDPDSSQHKRGASGNTFALVGEPEFDRIVRWQPQGALVRSHCPQVGVQVCEAYVAEVGQPDEKAQRRKDIEGATVDLLGAPVFIGRNHVVSEDGEPIDPFELRIETKDGGFQICRPVLGSGEMEEKMTPLQRRATGRYPAAPPQACHESLMENMAMLRELGGVDSSPLAYLERRRKALKEDARVLQQEATEVVELAQAQARLALLEECVPGTMLYSRFFFQVSYRHTLSGPPMVVSDLLLEQDTPWLIEYTMGFYDSDAMSALVWGELRIPIGDDPRPTSNEEAQATNK